MNDKKDYFFGFLAVFGSNFFSLIISVAITLLFPKILSMIDYSYFQLYLFYSSFIVFGHLGIVDGIYLKCGGAFYETLNFSLLHTQFKLLSIMNIALSLIIFLISVNFVIYEKKIVIFICSIAIILATKRIFYSQLLLATARMKEYAKVMITERLTFITLCLLYFVVVDITSYVDILIIDLLARCTSYFYVKNMMPEIKESKDVSINVAIQKTINDILVGFNLWFSNLTSMLIIGVFRFSIEMRFDVLTFGMISLAFSAVNAFVVLSNAASVTMFPIMRRLNEEYIIGYFRGINDILCYLGLTLQALYFPLYEILFFWLPQYRESFVYLGVLFPLCIYDIKWTSLESTFLKVTRKEKMILRINIISCFFSLCIAMCIYNKMFSIVFSMICMVSVFLLKHLMGIYVIKKELKIKKYSFKVEVLTLMLVGTYYGLFFSLESIKSMIVYLLLLLIVIVLNMNNIKRDYKTIKKIYTVQ